LGRNASPLVAALCGLGILTLVGCDPERLLPEGDSSLTSETGGRQGEQPSCTGCHAAIPSDVRHIFHLTSAVANRSNLRKPGLNGPITCLDCHFGSLAHFSFEHAETTWVNPLGETLLHVSEADTPYAVSVARAYRPLPAIPSDAPEGEILAREIDARSERLIKSGAVLEWLTEGQHFDHKAQVSFPPNNVRSPADPAQAYHPESFSCSAIACHSSVDAAYRWANPAKGRGGCPSWDGHDPACGEAP
jgi:hypothetical protein